jgi:pimeloyl-ACP methyl ester carboxylesterase
VIYYKEYQAELREQLRQMMLEHSGAVWMDPRRGKYLTTADLDRVAAITIPTAIFAGERDKVFLKLAHLLAERIKDSRLIVYDEIGHMLNLEAPGRFNRDLELFLSHLT